MDAAASAFDNLFKSVGKPGTTTQEDIESTGQTKAPIESSTETTEQTKVPMESSTATTGGDTKTGLASKDVDTTVDQHVNPSVQHEKVTEKHLQSDETVIDRERHQHHYHTTVQPLKDREVRETQNDYTEADTEYRNVNRDDDAAGVKAQVDKDQSRFQNTTEQGELQEKLTTDSTLGSEHVHHHLHETIQPIIEKETIQPTVTHNKIPVKETIQEASQNHGVTTKPTVSLDDFKATHSTVKKDSEDAYDGEPKVT